MIKNYTKTASLLISYLLITGLSYQIAYWMNFDINIFEFSSISEIASVAIPSVSLSLASIFLSVFIDASTNFSSSLPEGGGRETQIGIVLNKYRQGFFIIFALIILTPSLLIYLQSKIMVWKVLPMSIATVITMLLKYNYHKTIQLLQNIPWYIIYFIISIPLFSFGQGKYNSALIYQNINYLYVFKDDLIRNTSTDKNEKYKFIGKAGKFFIFLSVDNNTTILLNSENFSNIHLLKYNVKSSQSP